MLIVFPVHINFFYPCFRRFLHQLDNRNQFCARQCRHEQERTKYSEKNFSLYILPCDDFRAIEHMLHQFGGIDKLARLRVDDHRSIEQARSNRRIGKLFIIPRLGIRTEIIIAFRHPYGNRDNLLCIVQITAIAESKCEQIADMPASICCSRLSITF